MAHGETGEGATIAAAVLPAIQKLDDRSRFYHDLVYHSLNEASRRALEVLMKGYEYQSDFAKKYVAQGRAEEAARAVLMVLGGPRRCGVRRPSRAHPGACEEGAGRFEKRRMTRAVETLEIVVSGKPVRAGIDPFHEPARGSAGRFEKKRA